MKDRIVEGDRKGLTDDLDEALTRLPPLEIINKLQAEISRALKSPELTPKLAVQGVEPRYNTPAETAAAMVAERDRLARLIRETNFKPGQ